MTKIQFPSWCGANTRGCNAVLFTAMIFSIVEMSFLDHTVKGMS